MKYYPVIQDYFMINHEIRIPSLTNQDSMESRILIMVSYNLYILVLIMDYAGFSGILSMGIYITNPVNQYLDVHGT